MNCDDLRHNPLDSNDLRAWVSLAEHLESERDAALAEIKSMKRDWEMAVAMDDEALAADREMTKGLQALREWLLPCSDGLSRIIGERIDALLARKS